MTEMTDACPFRTMKADVQVKASLDECYCFGSQRTGRRTPTHGQLSVGGNALQQGEGRKGELLAHVCLHQISGH